MKKTRVVFLQIIMIVCDKKKQFEIQVNRDFL